MGDEFAGESAGEEGGRELVHLPARLGQPQLKLVGQRKLSPHGLLDDVAQSGGGLMIEHSESFRNKTGIGLEHGGFR